MTDLSQYFSPPDSNVFALTNLPEVVKGALFSRYSRSPDGLKEILAKEFLDEAGEEKAQAFYDRVLGAYGDDSVAELGGAHVAIEGVSDLVAQEILNSRIGISPLAKSTRYVDFGKARSPYFIPTDIDKDACAAQLYHVTMRSLYQTYNSLLPRVCERLKLFIPQGDASAAAYNRSIQAKALDLIRGLLPLATLTNLGLFGNGRAYEYLIVKLNASKHREANEIARKLKAALDSTIAPFVKHSTGARGIAYTAYLEELRGVVEWEVPLHLGEPSIPSNNFSSHSTGARIVKFDPLAAESVVEGIIYGGSNQGFAAIESYVASLDGNEKDRILREYAGDRKSRHQRPGRALELADYTFEICTDIGAYRDLHRHRLTTELPQPTRGDLGYEIPFELTTLGCGIAEDYILALDSAKSAFDRLVERGFYQESVYILPMAYRCRWLHKMNLREAVHLIELRSQPQGHIGYRQIAWEMADEIARVTPLLASQLRFADRQAGGLGRLNAEIKLEQKNQNVDN
jgi:thymidylate synthase ThyX